MGFSQRFLSYYFSLRRSPLQTGILYGRWGIVLFCFMGCMGAPKLELPPIKVQALSNYNQKQTQKGLCIAIDPFTDAERQQQYFGANILEEGIVAVQLVFSNESNKTAWYLPRNRSYIATKTGNIIRRTNPPENLTPRHLRELSERSSKQAKKLKSAAVPAGIAIGIAPPLMLPILPVYAKNISNFTKVLQHTCAIQMQLVDHMIPETAVPPGDSIQGFVYFRLMDSDASDLDSLTLTVERLGTGEICSFVFEL